MTELQQAPEQAPQKQSHTLSIAQLVFGLLAMLVLLLISIILFGSGWASVLSQNGQRLQAGATFMSAFAFLSAALVLLPSSFFAFQRISGKEFNIGLLSRLGKISQKRILLMAIIVLALGGLLSANESLSAFALAPIHSIASALIVYLLLLWALQGIELGSPQRYWGILAAGIIFGPLIAIIFEILLGVFLLLIAVLYIATQSQYAGLIEQLSRIDTFNISEPQLLELFGPLLSDPIIIVLLLAFIALSVPLIEESLKPIGLYLSMGKKWSPASGFALGALSGSGFALFENLALGIPANGWLPVMIARIGTTSMHLLTSGLIGWALVRARNEKRYLQLIGTYLLSVFLHGLWNGLAILVSLSTLEQQPGIFESSALSSGMLLSLLILALGSIFLLRFNNRKLVNAS